MSTPPFSLAGVRPQDPRSLGPSHTRESTVRPGIPIHTQAEHTPKPRASGKPLPDVVSGAATVGRLEGKSTAAATAKDVRSRSGSAGDAPAHGRRIGDLKIPARISMRQGSLKRELEAVKEFATSVEGEWCRRGLWVILIVL